MLRTRLTARRPAPLLPPPRRPAPAPARAPSLRPPASARQPPAPSSPGQRAADSAPTRRDAPRGKRRPDSPELRGARAKQTGPGARPAPSARSARAQRLTCRAARSRRGSGPGGRAETAGRTRTRPPPAAPPGGGTRYEPAAATQLCAPRPGRAHTWGAPPQARAL